MMMSKKAAARSHEEIKKRARNPQIVDVESICSSYDNQSDNH